MDLTRLKELNAKANKGRGIQTVANIIRCIEADRLNSAQWQWQIDGDKIPTYADYEALYQECINLLGCRAHLQHNCQHFACQRGQKSPSAERLAKRFTGDLK